MTAIILAIHTIIVLALVGVVLLQRSEGGALGMGGGGGGFMSGRGAATALTRSTAILSALFFTSSLALALTADRGITEEEVLRDLTGDAEAPRQIGAGELRQEDVLDILGTEPAAPVAPLPETPGPQTPGPQTPGPETPAPEELPAEDVPAEGDPR